MLILYEVAVDCRGCDGLRSELRTFGVHKDVYSMRVHMHTQAGRTAVVYARSACVRHVGGLDWRDFVLISAFLFEWSYVSVIQCRWSVAREVLSGMDWRRSDVDVISWFIQWRHALRTPCLSGRQVYLYALDLKLRSPVEFIPVVGC